MKRSFRKERLRKERYYDVATGYSEIPLLRPPKIKTSCLLKTLFEKFDLFFLHFPHPVYLCLETTFGTVQSGLKDHFWTFPKVVLI